MAMGKVICQEGYYSRWERVNKDSNRKQAVVQHRVTREKTIMIHQDYTPHSPLTQSTQITKIESKPHPYVAYLGEGGPKKRTSAFSGHELRAEKDQDGQKPWR